jgi:hypothetical protein
VSRTVTVAVLLAVLAGCGKKASQANDLLRARIIELEAQVEALADRNRELETALQEATAGPENLPQEVLDNTPHVARIEIDRRSHALDADGDGRADGLLVYVRPADGRGRFVQLAGWLSVHAADLPADADADSLGRVTLDPAALRESYRTSFMGTHYRVVLPVTPPSGRSEGPCTVRAIYKDGRSGRSFSAQREIDLRP